MTGKQRISNTGKFLIDAQGKRKICDCCASLCDVGSSVDVTLSGLSDGLCTDCAHCPGGYFQIKSLSADGTYTVPLKSGCLYQKEYTDSIASAKEWPSNHHSFDPCDEANEHFDVTEQIWNISVHGSFSNQISRVVVDIIDWINTGSYCITGEGIIFDSGINNGPFDLGEAIPNTLTCHTSPALASSVTDSGTATVTIA